MTLVHPNGIRRLGKVKINNVFDMFLKWFLMALRDVISMVSRTFIMAPRTFIMVFRIFIMVSRTSIKP